MSNKQFGMSLEHWSGDFEEVRGWWVSRKLNGWSCIWDGGVTRGLTIEEAHARYPDAIPLDPSRPGLICSGLWTLGRSNGTRSIIAPKYWLDDLPEGVPLHGELWYNDDITFIKTLIKRTSESASLASKLWEAARLRVFNVPSYTDLGMVQGCGPFDKPTTQGAALAKAKSLTNPNRSFYDFVPQQAVNSPQQLTEWLNAFRKGHWEGLCFMNPDAFYECKRSKSVLKYKPDYDDEAVVVDYNPGKGRHAGKMGSVTVTMRVCDKHLSIPGCDPSKLGKTVVFRVGGFEDPEREWDTVRRMFPVGKKIAFTYKIFSKHGVPQSANYNRCPGLHDEDME